MRFARGNTWTSSKPGVKPAFQRQALSYAPEARKVTISQVFVVQLPQDFELP